MITKEQLRAARAILELEQRFVAGKLDITPKTISNMEAGSGEPASRHLSALKTFYEARGIEFTDFNGVRQNPSGLRRYRGNAEFREFYDDLYETARTVGGDLCLLNAVSHLVINALGADFVKKQQERMDKIRNNFTYRVIFAQGDDVFFGARYCEYRWIASKFFNETAIFIFGDKVGFATFKDNDVEVVVHEDANIANTQRHAFNFFWLNATEPDA